MRARRPAAPADAAARPPARWVRVSVATLWVRPGRGAQRRRAGLRRARRPARLGRQADGGPEALAGRQARDAGAVRRQGLPARHVRRRGRSVAVAGQPTPRRTLGLPGLAADAAAHAEAPSRAAADRSPSCVAATAWLYEAAALERARARALLRHAPPGALDHRRGGQGRAAGGALRLLRRDGVDLHATGGAWPALSGARLVAEARRFLGLQYVWAGTSGFGLDCSGFTHLRSTGRSA